MVFINKRKLNLNLLLKAIFNSYYFQFIRDKKTDAKSLSIWISYIDHSVYWKSSILKNK